ncbi:hypothetical protein QQ020_08220 [Fulvivirgaceae bacterium BMA12]|uniref:Lipocalin-like domain-containing protein n=1 Tax=Agaribacillus aureus TaxID=3051825 RepID=A0ABT8L2S7_9BACT|nr:hypothetical protein [Fulvivirgaceae bacterium BMA12]
MNKLATISMVVLLLAQFGCNSDKAEKESATTYPETMEGSWRLVSYIDHEHGATDWTSYSDDIIYEKNITPTHFTWIKYEKSKDDMVGTGGGTYVYEEGIYTEDIKFFFPPGSSILGQSIPFDVYIKEGKLYQTGYAWETEFDPESGNMVVVDTVKIEEIWEQIPEEENNTDELIGTWELISYKEEDDSIRLEPPGFFGYIKHITPTHFNWIFFNKEDDEVFAEGGGKYSLKGDIYTEFIEYRYPRGDREGVVVPHVGTVLPFTKKIEDDLWYHTGYVKKVTVDSVSGTATVVDSTKIDEIWRKVAKTDSATGV